MWSCLFVCGSCSERSPSGGHTWLWLACCDSSSPHHTRSHYPQPPALQLSSVTVAATTILRPCQDFNHSAVCCALTHFFLILYCTAPLFFKWKQYCVSGRWLNVCVSLLYIISHISIQYILNPVHCDTCKVSGNKVHRPFGSSIMLHIMISF